MKRKIIPFLILSPLLFIACSKTVTKSSSQNIPPKSPDTSDIVAETQNFCDNEEIKKIILSETVPAGEYLQNFDFSEIINPDYPPYLGYIGENYTRLHIAINSVKKTTGQEYSVSGKTKVANHEADFAGTLKITDILLLKTNIEMADLEQGVTVQEGIILGTYDFKEAAGHNNNGVLKGLFRSYWYIDKDNNVSVAMPPWDGFSNNQFLGTWTGYHSGKSKTAAWGHFRVPCSAPFDIGAGAFHPLNRENGWEDYNSDGLS